MRIFQFDPVTGMKGDFLTNSPRPCALGKFADGVILPEPEEGVIWAAHTSAWDINNRPMQFDEPVCFCMGKWTVGTDSFWHWIVLIPE